MISRRRRNFTDQIAQELTEAIRAGTYRPGEQLPTVERLGLEMGAGRSTVREALRLLQARGEVEIIHGRGTFVSRARVTRTTGVLYSFSEILRARGMRPSSRILQSEVLPADSEAADRLQITPGDNLNVLKRLRFADDVPIALETSLSAHVRFPDLLEQEWTPETSLYALLEDYYGVIIESATQIIRAMPVSRPESGLLQIKPYSPALLVEGIAYDQHETPIEFGRSWYRADRYDYRVFLRRERKQS